MVPDLSKAVFEALKLKPRYLLAISVFCAFYLFSPEEWLQQIDALQFAKDYRFVFGAVFVASWVFMIPTAIHGISNLYYGHKLRQLIIQRLDTLTEEEKQILRHYIGYQTRTNILYFSDGVVQGLVAARIIQKADPFFHLGKPCAFNINEIAWQYLHKHESLLEGETMDFRCDA